VKSTLFFCRFRLCVCDGLSRPYRELALLRLAVFRRAPWALKTFSTAFCVFLPFFALFACVSRAVLDKKLCAWQRSASEKAGAICSKALPKNKKRKIRRKNGKYFLLWAIFNQIFSCLCKNCEGHWCAANFMQFFFCLFAVLVIKLVNFTKRKLFLRMNKYYINRINMQ